MLRLQTTLDPASANLWPRAWRRRPVDRTDRLRAVAPEIDKAWAPRITAIILVANYGRDLEVLVLQRFRSADLRDRNFTAAGMCPK
jgi:hypothetical protein